MEVSKWAESLRKHYAVASVGSSTLMHQSGKGRNERAQNYLLNNFPLEGISSQDNKSFLKLLDKKTTELSRELPKPKDKSPNWGASRKVLNIYLRLCAMNKDVNSFYKLKNIESYLEVPLDNHIVKEIDKYSKTTNFASSFTIRDLIKKESDTIQNKAILIALSKDIHRYELDVLFWNYKKING
jgi:hypothetical protein